MLFDIADYIAALKQIQANKLINLYELAKDININSMTLRKIFNSRQEVPMQYKTIRKLRDYIESNLEIKD